MSKLLHHPWSFAILAFLLLICAWGSLAYVASKVRPRSVPVETQTTTTEP